MSMRFRLGNRKDGCKTVFAYDGKTKVGWIGACQSLRYLEVQRVHVTESHRRQKIGTALYAKMAEVGCSIGKPLASAGYQRSRDAEGFWQKQLRLGRATVDRELAVISCPAPSLEARGRR